MSTKHIVSTKYRDMKYLAEKYGTNQEKWNGWNHVECGFYQTYKKSQYGDR